MALLDIFKKKPIRQAQGRKAEKKFKDKEMEKAAKKSAPALVTAKDTEINVDKKSSPAKATEAKTEKKIEKPSTPKKSKKSIGDAYKILSCPHVTEKAGDLAGKNQYVFKIFSNANKTEVKKAVEEVYNVDVVKVMIINIPKRKRRLGRIEGFRKGYKKAIVEIAKGQKIEIMPR